MLLWYSDKHCPHCGGMMRLTTVHEETISPKESYLCTQCILALLPSEEDKV